MVNCKTLPTGLVFTFLFVLGLLSLLLSRGGWIFLRLDIRAFNTVSHCNGSWHHLVFSRETSSFELSLAVKVLDGGCSNRSSEKWVFGSVFQKNESCHAQSYTFEQMAEVADDDWKRPINHSVYRLYPQALDMKQVVANITHCVPIPEAPIFNQTIRFLNVSSTLCVPGKPAIKPLDAIVMVKSAVYNFEDRERIRKAYASDSDLRLAMIFSVGLPRSSGGRFFQRDGFNVSLPERAGESMERMQSQRADVLVKLAEESRIKGDLVLGDYEDTYYNLSLKLFHTFQWASAFCLPYFTHHQQQVRPPVFIVLDDDYAFNASLLKAELRNISDTEIRRVTWGIPVNIGKVFRNPASRAYGKWTLSKREVPWPMHAPYAPSIFLVFGADVIQEIALTMHFTRQIPVDDAWLGIIMTKLNLTFEYRPHMYKGAPKRVPK